jgi:hypothetical protein
MQSALETTPAQHVWNITAFIQEATRQTKIAFEVQHGNDGGRHGFGIGYLTLCLFMMTQAFEQLLYRQKTTTIGCHEFSFALVVGIPQLY